MPGRIVLFGATGYTGELTARALAGRGERPVLAGRSEARVRALAEALGGLDWAVADVDEPASVRALVERGDVLLTTVGPFARFGAAAVEAAVDAGAHYLDSTGEAAFIRAVFTEWGPRAQDAGCTLLTAMGCDWVPGNLAGELALREAGPEATGVQIGYFVSGGPGAGGGGASGGTRASSMSIVLEPAYAFADGRMVVEPTGMRARSFVVDGRECRAFSAGATEHFALPAAHPKLRDVEVYLGWFGRASDAVRALALGASLATRVPGVRSGLGALASRVLTGSSGGPDAAEREGTGSLVIAQARDREGRPLAEVRLEGVNVYELTAGLLAWSASAVAAGRLRVGGGAAGPVAAFGVEALEEGLRASGMQRVS